MIVSADEFLRLRYSDDPDEYSRAAQEPATLDVWLEIVRQHPDSRIWVARNKTVPNEILLILVGDENPEVRFAVAMKRKLAPELLDRLANDSDESIRLQVARHGNTSRQILERLVGDRWAAVANAAAERLGRES